MKKVIEIFKPVVETLNDNNKNMILNFSAGDRAFDDFIKFEAISDMKCGNGVTYLVINEHDNKRELVAYYTVATSTIHSIDRYDFEDDYIPDCEKREHFSPISAFMVKMFAVSEKYQDTYYCEELVAGLILKNMIFNLYDMSISIIGAKRIVLCSVESARNFYRLGNFKNLDRNMYTLFDKIDAQDNYPMYLSLHDV